MSDVCYHIYIYYIENIYIYIYKAFPMLLLTIATRIAKVTLDPSVVRTLVCLFAFSFLLFA